MAGIEKALVHGVGVQQRASANESQLFEVIKNLHGFDIEQVVMVEQSPCYYKSATVSVYFPFFD
jgi:hypothetical protein